MGACEGAAATDTVWRVHHHSTSRTDPIEGISEQLSSRMGRSGGPPPGPANTGRSSRGRFYPNEAKVPLPSQVPQLKLVSVR